MTNFGFFTKPFDAIDKSDLNHLVSTRRVREHLHLDYKGQIEDHGCEKTIELLADIIAMANAGGGLIIIGVEEDSIGDDGTPGAMPGIANGAEEANWIQNVCISGIDEKIPDLHIRDIALANGRSCILIQAPNSPRKPHMIDYNKHHSFRIRNGRSKRFLTIQEVCSMILNMATYRASLDRFLTERRQALADLAKGDPWIALSSNTTTHSIRQQLQSHLDQQSTASLSQTEIRARIYAGRL